MHCWSLLCNMQGSQDRLVSTASLSACKIASLIPFVCIYTSVSLLLLYKLYAVYTTPPVVDRHNPSISDDRATSKTATAVIAVLACLLFVALSAAVYFASNYISLKKRLKQLESAREMKTTEAASTQDSQ